MSQLTEAYLSAQATRTLFLFWRAENERWFPLARVPIDWRGAWECKVSSAAFRWMVSRPGADANMCLIDSRVDVLVDVQHTGSGCNSVC